VNPTGRALLAGALGAAAVGWVVLPDGAAVESPSFGAPVILEPGGELPVTIRVAIPGVTTLDAAALEHDGVKIPLTRVEPAGRGPRQTARFRIPADCRPGNYDLVVRAGAGQRTARRAVAVLREIPERFTVAQISDLHFGASAEGEASVARIVAELNRLAPAAVLVTGDIAQDGKPQEYERAQRALARLSMPVVCIPGNHDRRGWGAYLTSFGGPTGSVRLGSWTFLRLDSAHGRDQFTESQVRDIAQALDEAEPHRVIVLLHIPLVGTRSVKAHAHSVMELFRRKGVPLVLSGHWHYRAGYGEDPGGRGEPGAGATTYVVTATAGGPPVPGPTGHSDLRGFTLIAVDRGKVTAIEPRTVEGGGDAAAAGSTR